MKYSMLLLLLLLTVLSGSSQAISQSRVRQSVTIIHYPLYGEPGKTTMSEVERYYDTRIDEVEKDGVLKPHQKKRMIRDINDERKMHVKAILKWERKESKHHWKYYNY